MPSDKYPSPAGSQLFFFSFRFSPQRSPRIFEHIFFFYKTLFSEKEHTHKKKQISKKSDVVKNKNLEVSDRMRAPATYHRGKTVH